MAGHGETGSNLGGGCTVLDVGVWCTEQEAWFVDSPG